MLSATFLTIAIEVVSSIDHAPLECRPDNEPVRVVDVDLVDLLIDKRLHCCGALCLCFPLNYGFDPVSWEIWVISDLHNFALFNAIIDL